VRAEVKINRVFRDTAVALLDALEEFEAERIGGIVVDIDFSFDGPGFSGAAALL
jgi:hypothetical protein